MLFQYYPSKFYYQYPYPSPMYLSLPLNSPLVLAFSQSNKRTATLLSGQEWALKNWAKPIFGFDPID